MDLSNLLAVRCEWLRAEGAENDIVLATRIRLARNLQGYPFINRATPEQIAAMEEMVANKLRQIPELQSYVYLTINEIAANDALLLFERHLISKEHTYTKWRRSVLFKKDESVSLMIAEEDHFRLQMLRSGLAAASVWANIDAFDDLLASAFTFCFHNQFGYLTACPTNVGTGMRASVLLHLPALRMSNQMDKIHKAIAKFNMVFRGFYGEGSVAQGDFFQLSNQISLGKKEEAIINILECLVPQLAGYEREIRHNMMAKQRGNLEKHVMSALQALTKNDTMTSEQAMTHLSGVRMGVHLGLIPLNIHQVNEMFIMTQPAHLQKKDGRQLTAAERDRVRALFLKTYLQNYLS